MIVIEDYEQPDVKLDLCGGTSGTYAGLDRFGRVIDQRWRYYGGTPGERDRFAYGYDANSNRTYRENLVSGAGALGELYHSGSGYDGLNRLGAFARGTLDGEKDGISGTASREETFTLDALGNWKGYLTKTAGSTDLDQGRTHDKANQITAISASGDTPDWVDPVHDAKGNMTTIPKPVSPKDGQPKPGRPGGSVMEPLAAGRRVWNQTLKVFQDRPPPHASQLKRRGRDSNPG